MEEYQDSSLRGRVFQSIREDILNGKFIKIKISIDADEKRVFEIER